MPAEAEVPGRALCEAGGAAGGVQTAAVWDLGGGCAADSRLMVDYCGTREARCAKLSLIFTRLVEDGVVPQALDGCLSDHFGWSDIYELRRLERAGLTLARLDQGIRKASQSEQERCRARSTARPSAWRRECRAISSSTSTGMCS